MNAEVPERVKSKQRYKANIKHYDTKFSEKKSLWNCLLKRTMSIQLQWPIANDTVEKLLGFKNKNTLGS